MEDFLAVLGLVVVCAFIANIWNSFIDYEIDYLLGFATCYFWITKIRK